MTDIRPLLQSRPGSRLSAMVRAAAVEQPPSGLSGQILAALGVGGAVTATTAAASGSVVAATLAAKGGGASSSSALSALAIKWVAVGTVGGVMAAAGLNAAFSNGVATDKAVSARPVQPAPLAGPAIVEKAVAAAPSSEPRPLSGSPAIEAAPVEKVPSERPALPAASADAGLREELRLIDSARAAMAAGKPHQALRQLAAYGRISTTGILDREARVLRIEALVKSGDLQQARLLADAYLHAYPNDLHARRLRELSSAGTGGSIGHGADMSAAED